MQLYYIETDPQNDIFFKILPNINCVSILKMRNITDMKIAYKVLIIRQILS